MGINATDTKKVDVGSTLMEWQWLISMEFGVIDMMIIDRTSGERPLEGRARMIIKL